MKLHLLPEGLRPRLLTLVLVSVVCSAVLMLAHEQDEAIVRATNETSLFSRLVAARVSQSLRGVPAAGLTVDRVKAAVSSAARDIDDMAGVSFGDERAVPVDFVVVDRGGRILAHAGSPAPAHDSTFSAFEARPGSVWRQDVRDPDGHQRVVSFAPLPPAGSTPLWAGASVDVDELWASQAWDLWRSLGGVALLGLVIALTAWRVVSVAVTRRLNALLEATRRLGGGDLSSRTGFGDESGELGALARQFDEMATAIELHAGEHARAEKRLRLSEARKSAVLEASLDGIVLLDHDGRMIECNATARRMFGCDGRHCVRHRLADIFPEATPFDGSRFNRPAEVFESRCHRLNGETFPAEISIAPIRDPAAAGLFTVTVRDISERKEWERSLETLSYMDDLTGLYNRRGFLLFATQQLKMAVRNRQSVVMVGVDMDGLKTINDTFGHANGDRALVELARALRASFRESDVIGRIGGDEFVVLTTESNEAGAEHALGRLAMRLAGRNGEGDLPWPLAASLGWVRSRPNRPDELVTLLARVDERMYEQKRRRAGAEGQTAVGEGFARPKRPATPLLVALEPPRKPASVTPAEPLPEDVVRLA